MYAIRSYYAIGLLGELGLVGVEVAATGVDDPLAVQQQDVLARHAEIHQQAHAGDARSTGAHRDDARLLQLLALQVQGGQQAHRDDDGGAVLVVVEDRRITSYNVCYTKLLRVITCCIPLCGGIL